jgi:diguanylate cyclase (GGDEF)-like protein
MDRATLFTTQATLLFFLGIGVFLSRRAYRWQTPDKSAEWFAAGYLLGGAGLTLQAFRGFISPWIAVILGNFLLFLIMPCLNRAIAAATRQKTVRSFYTMLALNVVTVSSFVYFTFVHPSVAIRTVEACVLMMILLSMNIILLMRSADEVIEPATRMLALLMALHFVSSGSRIVMLLRNGSEWFNVAGIIAIVGWAITFMWIDALRLRAELEQRAMLDPLTSLFNRRALDVIANREIQRAARKRQPCSALMMDIDRFKEINDGMGHAAGDSTLCAVAASIRSCLRASDIATRLGGDEFFVLLPEADETAANLVVARIRVAIQQLRLRTLGGQEFSVSLSIGQVTHHAPNPTVGELLHASDVLLYREKKLAYDRRGRRQLRSHSEAAGAHVQPSRA